MWVLQVELAAKGGRISELEQGAVSMEQFEELQKELQDQRLETRLAQTRCEELQQHCEELVCASAYAQTRMRKLEHADFVTSDEIPVHQAAIASMCSAVCELWPIRHLLISLKASLPDAAADAFILGRWSPLFVLKLTVQICTTAAD